MNLLSTLVLIPLLNPLLRYGGIKGGSTVQHGGQGVNNYFKGQEPVRGGRYHIQQGET